MVSTPLHHLWRDVRGAIRMISHPVIRIIGAKEHQADKDHPQGGLVLGCLRLLLLVLLLT